jgi:hypothetical protein
MIDRRKFLLTTVSAAALGLAVPPAFGAERPGAANAITLRDASGDGVRDYPVRIGRPFLHGEIPGAPQAVVDGTPLPTQADIKTRWPDGSVKHAVLSFIVPRIASRGRVEVAFKNQQVTANAPLGSAQMLASEFDFEAAMRIMRDGQTQSVSAREMLANGDFTVWCAGPIATTIILADHSAARKYDIGFEEIRPVRPVFHATFWPSLNKVHVRAIGENSCSEAMQDVAYSLVLTGGLAAPAEAFRQDAIMHAAGTRWTRSFWIGGEPSRQIDIDHNLSYLAKTMAFPNFDTSVSISDAEISRDYARWLREPRNLYDSGGWQKRMPSAGGRGDIGPYTCAQATWLYTGDHRIFEIVSTQADLAGAWPLQVREGDSSRWYDAKRQTRAIGLPVSVYARPNLWLFDDRGNRGKDDQIEIRGDRIRSGNNNLSWGGWQRDGAHQPDPYSALYTLTGDYFALEQLQLWAAATVVRYDPAYKGPAPSGAILDEVRGKAWVMRSRTHAAYLSPDGSPEKEYFSRMMDDVIAFFEGRLGIRGTPYENSPLWRFADERWAYRSPLHFWQDQEVHDGQGLKEELVGKSSAPWEHYMLLFELGVTTEKGFATGPLLSWTAFFLTSQFKDPQTFSFYNVQRYWAPSRDPSGNYFRTWTETLAGYNRPQPETIPRNTGDGYMAYAYGASTMIVNQPGGAEAYSWLRRNVYEPLHSRYGACPKWAYVPRT